MIAQTVFLNERVKRKAFAFALVVVTYLLTSTSSSFAQQAPPAKPASAAAPVKILTKPVASKPSWAELTPMQQQALKPLAVSWHSISEAQKRKWIEISKNYPTLLPADQHTIHSRMNEWVALSPLQRAEARLNFAKTKELSTQLTPEEKKAKWQIYQALSPEEKQKLASKATPRPVGAALAVKPVAPQKLTAVTPSGSKLEAKTLTKNTPPQTATSPPPPSEASPAGLGTPASN